MDKTTRITITAMEKGSGTDSSERIEVLVDAWHDGEFVEVRVDEIIGIIEKARMQYLGRSFIDGALRKVDGKLSFILDRINAAAMTLDIATDLLNKKIQTRMPWYRHVLKWRPW